MGQTTSWRVCSLNSNTSIAVYYEIVNQHSNPIPAGTPFYLQYCVRYKRSNGEIRLRVMTVARRQGVGGGKGGGRPFTFTFTRDTPRVFSRLLPLYYIVRLISLSPREKNKKISRRLLTIHNTRLCFFPFQSVNTSQFLIACARRVIGSYRGRGHCAAVGGE